MTYDYHTLRINLSDKIIKSLAHKTREEAMYIILSWISIEDLEKSVAPTICGYVYENTQDTAQNS